LLIVPAVSMGIDRHGFSYAAPIVLHGCSPWAKVFVPI